MIKIRLVGLNSYRVQSINGYRPLGIIGIILKILCIDNTIDKDIYAGTYLVRICLRAIRAECHCLKNGVFSRPHTDMFLGNKSGHIVY